MVHTKREVQERQELVEYHGSSESIIFCCFVLTSGSVETIEKRSHGSHIVQGVTSDIKTETTEK